MGDLILPVQYGGGGSRDGLFRDGLLERLGLVFWSFGLVRRPGHLGWLVVRVMGSGTQRGNSHSFPRPRADETPSQTASRGWAILQSMQKLGLVLAPEVVEWDDPIGLGTPSPIQVLQRRVCFTELSPQELGGHSTRFGPFALEFDTTALRRIGALPVIYMPQALSAQDPLALLGPFVVGHLGQVRSFLEKLNELDQLDSLAYWQAQNPEANSIADDCLVTLRNGDEPRGVVQEFEVPLKTIRGVLNYLDFETAPFDTMIGATTIAQAMFYPTDDDHHHQELGYYRQREWRITADYSVNGSPRGRNLGDEEKDLLLGLDESFWGKETHSSRGLRRVDEALALIYPAPDELISIVRRLIVPDDFADDASETFGDRVATVSQVEES